jgi:hypothetical protein
VPKVENVGKENESVVRTSNQAAGSDRLSSPKIVKDLDIPEDLIPDHECFLGSRDAYHNTGTIVELSPFNRTA